MMAIFAILFSTTFSRADYRVLFNDDRGNTYEIIRKLGEGGVAQVVEARAVRNPNSPHESEIAPALELGGDTLRYFKLVEHQYEPDDNWDSWEADFHSFPLMQKVYGKHPRYVRNAS